MTVGQMFEGIFGKHTCMTGEEHMATTFIDHQVDEISQKLHDIGFERYGKERLYHGMYGTPIETMIYIGPTYYQRLKHLVSDKIHSRGSQGPIVNLTRQPMEGKAKDGGLRFGRSHFAKNSNVAKHLLVYGMVGNTIKLFGKLLVFEKQWVLNHSRNSMVAYVNRIRYSKKLIV